MQVADDAGYNWIMMDTKGGEFYADLDEDSGLYCVFHTETEKAYASFADGDEAERDAALRNECKSSTI